MSNISIFYTCHFCKKPASEVDHLIFGPDNIGICNECVELCVIILKDKKEALIDKQTQGDQQL